MVLLADSSCRASFSPWCFDAQGQLCDIGSQQNVSTLKSKMTRCVSISIRIYNVITLLGEALFDAFTKDYGIADKQCFVTSCCRNAAQKEILKGSPKRAPTHTHVFREPLASDSHKFTEAFQYGTCET